MLVEFAIIALVLYILFAATMELGRAMFGTQTTQAAADLAAREISRTALSVQYTSLYGTGPNDTTAALNDSVVRQQIFDERLLVIDLDQNTGDLDLLFAGFPVVNQQLRTVMIFDQSAGRRLIRYPGALVTPGDESNLPALPTGFVDSGLRIAVPFIESRDANTGVETIRWVTVLEEITPGAFNVASAQKGMVGVRINYPFQAASLSAFQPSPNGPLEPNGSPPIQANDAGVTQSNPIPGGGSLANLAPDPNPDNQLQPNGGQYGLGVQLAFSQRVRPFSRLLTGQAIYRREVFSN